MFVIEFLLFFLLLALELGLNLGIFLGLRMTTQFSQSVFSSCDRLDEYVNVRMDLPVSLPAFSV